MFGSVQPTVVDVSVCVTSVESNAGDASIVRIGFVMSFSIASAGPAIENAFAPVIREPTARPNAESGARSVSAPPSKLPTTG